MASTSDAQSDDSVRQPERNGGPDALLARVDDLQARLPLIAVPVATAKKFSEDRGGNLAALLAYYAFFSLFPLLLVLVTVLGMVLSGNEELQDDILDSALARFPVIGYQIRENTGQLEGSGFVLGVGLVTALWAGSGVMRAAEEAMNDVWDVPMRARPRFPKAVLRAVGMLVVLGGGVVLTTLLTGFAGGIVNGFAARAVGVVLSGVINVGFFLLGFRILTARDVGPRQLLPGAVLAGVAWVVLQVAGGYLVNRYVKGASEIYGTFAVVIGLLWWLYLQSLITLYAAELNVVLTEHLWPRSLMGVRLEADRRTLQRHAEVEERYDPEDVRVGSRVAGGAESEPQAGGHQEAEGADGPVGHARNVEVRVPDKSNPDRSAP